MLNVIVVALVWETVWRILVVWVAGSIAFWYGRALVREPERVRWIGDWITIELARRSGREEAVAQRESELLKPERVRRIGRQGIWAGCVCFVLGILQLIVSVVQILAFVTNAQ